MPTPDPGYNAFLARRLPEPDIEPTEFGWVWTINGERHELFAPWLTVHVTQEDVMMNG